MSVVASDILFVRGDGGYRPSLASPVASLDLVKQTGDPRTTAATNTTSSSVFSEFHHSPRWLVKNSHNSQKTAKYKQFLGSALRSDVSSGPAPAPLCTKSTPVTPVSRAAGQTGSAGRRPPLPTARSSLSSITSLILGTNRFRYRSAKANHKSTTVLNKADSAIDHTSTTIITSAETTSDRSGTSRDHRSTTRIDHRPVTVGDQQSAIKETTTGGSHQSTTWIEEGSHTNKAPASQLPTSGAVRQPEPATPLGDVTPRRCDAAPDVTGSAAGAARPPRPGRPARPSLVAGGAAGRSADVTRQSPAGLDSAGSDRVGNGQEQNAESLPVAPPRRRRSSGRLACSVGDLLSSEGRPRLAPLEATHGVPSATTRLTIPLFGVRSPPKSAPSRDSAGPPTAADVTPASPSHDSTVRSHDSATPAAPRPRPRRHSKSTGSLLFAGEVPGSPPRATPRSPKFSIGKPFSENGLRTSAQLTPENISQATSERRSEKETKPEAESEPKPKPVPKPDSEKPAIISILSPQWQPTLSHPESHTEAERDFDWSSPDDGDSPLSPRRVLNPLSADSVSDLSAAVAIERRTYRSRPSESGASPATSLFTKHGGSSAERRRTQSAFNARRTIAHRRQAEATGSRSSSEPRRRHTATWVTGKINVSVTSVGRAASLTQLGAGGVSRALTVSDRSSSSPTLEQEKRDIRRYLYSSNLTSGSESPERERHLSEGCLRLGAPAQGDALSDRPADPQLLSPNSVGSGWSAVTADVLTTRDAADERSDVIADRCDVIRDGCGAREDECGVREDRVDSVMAGAVEIERERLPSAVPTPATNTAPRRLSTSVVHLWGPDESHLLPSGPSSLPSTVLRTKPPRPHSISSTALLTESGQQPSWLRQTQARRSLRDDRPSWNSEATQSATANRPDAALRPAADLANGQPPAEHVTSGSLQQSTAKHATRPALIDLTAESTVELSFGAQPEPPSCPPPHSPTEPSSDPDIPPPPPTQPPPESPTDSPPPLPSEPPPESPTESVPQSPWTSRFERPRRQSLSTSLPSFETVPVVEEGTASVGRKPPSVAPLSLWSDGSTGLVNRPVSRRPLRPTPAVSAADRGPCSLPVTAPDSSSGAADCTDERSGVGVAPISLPSAPTTVQVRVERPERATEAAAEVKRRRASTGVYLNGALPAENRTKTSFTISLGGGRKRPSLFSQKSSPSLLSDSQPSSLPTFSSKSPSYSPPAKQPSSLPGLRHSTAQQSASPSSAAVPTQASAAPSRQPASLPSLFSARQTVPSSRQGPTSLPSVPPPLPRSSPPRDSPPPQFHPRPRSPPPVRSPPSLRPSLRSPPVSLSAQRSPLRSPPVSLSAQRSSVEERTVDDRRDSSSDLHRQLEDDWARMERRHQAFLQHTARQRGQQYPRSILKKQSAPSLLESVAGEDRPGWKRDEQPRRRASNVNWHDLERTKQDIRAEIERMKRQLRSDMGTGGAGHWPPRATGAARPAGTTTTTSSSGRTVVETIHAIHIERDSSPGLVITEMPDDDGDDAASNHSGVVIEEVLDEDEPDSTRFQSQPSDGPGHPPRSPTHSRSQGSPATSGPTSSSKVTSAASAPWWRAPTVSEPSSPAGSGISDIPSWRRPSQTAGSSAATATPISHSTMTSDQTPACDGPACDVTERHVQVDQLNSASAFSQNDDLSLTHLRRVYVDKRKTVSIGTTDGARLLWPSAASESSPLDSAVEADPRASAVSPEPEMQSPAASPEPEVQSLAASPEPEAQSLAASRDPEVQSLAASPEPEVQSLAASPEPEVQSLAASPEPEVQSLAASPELEVTTLVSGSPAPSPVTGDVISPPVADTECLASDHCLEESRSLETPEYQCDDLKQLESYTELSVLSEFSRLSAAEQVPYTAESPSQSVSKPTFATRDTSYQIESERSCQSPTENRAIRASQQCQSRLQPRQEPQAMSQMPEHPNKPEHTHRPSLVKLSEEKCLLPQESETSQKSNSSAKDGQCADRHPVKSQSLQQVKPQLPPKASGKSRRPPSTFGSWKARHAGLVPTRAQQSGGSAMGRSVEAALDRLLAESSRADRATQATQRTRSSVGRAGTPQRSSGDRGGTPPRHGSSASRQGTAALRVKSAHRQTTSASRSEAHDSRQKTAPRRGTPAALPSPAAGPSDPLTVSSRDRAAEAGGRLGTRGAEGRSRVNGSDGSNRRTQGESGSVSRQTLSRNGSEQMDRKSAARRDKTPSRNSATNRDSQTGKTKSTQGKYSPKIERVQKNRLIISHKLNASSPHFQTEMKWNESGNSRHRRGKTPNGGDTAPPDETRHYHTVDVDGGTITSRVVTPGGDLHTTFRTSGGPVSPMSSDIRHHPTSARRMTERQSTSPRPNKSAHGCRITVQEFIV